MIDEIILVAEIKKNSKDKKNKKTFFQKFGNSLVTFFQIGRLGLIFFQGFCLPLPQSQLEQHRVLQPESFVVQKSTLTSEINTQECTSVQNKAIFSSVRESRLKNQYQYIISAKKHVPVDHKTHKRRLTKTVLVLVPVVSIGLPVYMHFSNFERGLLKSFYADMQTRPNISSHSQFLSVTKQALYRYLNYDPPARNFKIRTLSENKNFFLSRMDNAFLEIERDMYDFYAYNYNYDIALTTPREEKRLMTRYIFTIWAALWNQYLTMNSL
uniref:Uncharacterized protein n=1 Tax=Halimeda minima TaxID=170427 RepID=A0A386AYV5_9CHLO|nr:hypothetical protein [Halimeda minima]